MRRKLVAGNWKMNGTDIGQISAIAAAHPAPSVNVLICPPATLIAAAAQLNIAVGAQDCHPANSGAHTGDLSAPMLAAAGASYIITGHSERRTDHNESNTDVMAKSTATQATDLTAIICIGESLAQREAGETLTHLTAQLSGSIPANSTATNTVIAYEPIWAIGTGKIPTLAQIAEVHSHIRAHLNANFTDGNDFSILYGGSVKASNAPEIFNIPDVDGALVGGASLTVADFSPIITALENAQA